MSLRAALRCLQSFVLNRTTNQYVLKTHFRCLKDKHWNKELPTVAGKEDKDLVKIRVILKDQNGNIMGNKSLVEAKMLAQKWKLNLIEDKDLSKHSKYKEFKLVSNQYLAEIDEQLDPIQDNDNNKSDKEVETKDKSSPVPTLTHREVKHLVFSTKLNENDLMTKIKQIIRWLSRGHQIAINVTNSKNDKKVLDEIYAKFETELKGIAKLNQKKIKSNNTLKFMILPTVETKDLKNISSGDHITDEIDFENLDPNELLSDEFEHQLEKK